MDVFLLVTAGWIFSVCLHEFGHALVAYRGGDHTVRDKGYLTLNPLRYTHPVYSLALPLLFLFLGGIGLPGGAVYINDHLLRSRQWRTACSLAGPLMNVLLIFLLCLPFWGGLMEGERTKGIAISLAFLILLQISALVFNLLPIPPLDGFQAIAPWLPRPLTSLLMEHATTLTFVLFLMLWFVEPVNALFWTTVLGAFRRLGLDPTLAREGWSAFQFWQ